MNADSRYSEIYDVLTHISGVLYFVSTCINPFLYNIMSYKFREAFKGTCASCLHGRENLGYGAKGALSRNISQRSTSHSAHTCSSVCSSYVQQSQNATYILDQDFALLKCSIQRPLTVKFKKAPRTLAINSRSQPHQHQKDIDLTELDTYQYKQNFSYSTQFDPKRTHSGNTFFQTINNESQNDYSIFTMDSYKTDFEEVPQKSCNGPTSNQRYIYNDTGSYNSERYKSLCYPIAKRDNSSNVNTSPYDSPELTANSRKLEESLQNILKDLVKTDNARASEVANSANYSGCSIVKGFPKSKSVSSLLAVRTRKSNKFRKSIGLKDPF
ncbi:unnamed protein product [Hermetia illucens]|uniref:Uncharacterized protein n=2 Tax=Hermetia illucens TaxID=343691 RepID=A0A7R8UP96_HERIL|nr:unnamed protein product [Hermetia illucens]